MPNERIRNEGFAAGADSFSDDFASGTAVATEGQVEVIHGVYAHTFPLSGMTVGQARTELADRMNIDPESIAVVDGNEVGDDTVLGEGMVLNFVKHSGEKGAGNNGSMSDKLLIEKGLLTLTTDEGQQFALPEEKLTDMIRREIEPPVNGEALPDGLKFMEYQSPFLCVVHQSPPHVRALRWIKDDSPEPYGSGATFQTRRLSLPYAITFAVYFRRGDHLSLIGYNELYFRNKPLTSKADKLGYPALLNVSRIDIKQRSRAWICTQFLKCPPQAPWTNQLASLLDHTWNGAFNRSSEMHEGASWFAESADVHEDLHPISKWEDASAKNDAFALGVAWKPVKQNVGQLIDAMLSECSSNGGGTSMFARVKGKSKSGGGIVAKFLNFAQQENAKT